MRFADNFWNSEICNFSGFEILCKQMRDGKHTCKDYAEVLRQRAQAEDHYGRTLVKIGKSVTSSAEIGNLQKSLERMRWQMEACGKEHVKLGTMLMEEHNRVLQWTEAHREKRRAAEECVKKQQIAKKNQHKKATELKKSYNTKRREAEIAGAEFEDKKKVLPQKDIDKLEQRKIKMEQAATAADDSYRQAIDNLDDVAVTWQRETVNACNDFEQIERERLSKLRDSLWTLANLDSVACVNRDEIDEELRQSLVECDVEADLATFVTLKRVGNKPPDALLYEPYTLACALPVQPSLDLEQLSGYEEMEPNYESVLEADGSNCDVQPAGVEKHQLYCVQFDYISENTDELCVQAGDIVRVTDANSNNWWQVVTNSGQFGLVPSSYLKKKLPSP